VRRLFAFFRGRVLEGDSIVKFHSAVMLRQSITASILFAVLVYSSAQNLIFTTPVLFWGNTDFLSTQNVQVIDITPVREIGKSFTSKSQSLSQYFKASSSPELVVVYVESQLGTDQFSKLSEAYRAHPNGGALSHVKSLVETSRGSLILPYVQAEGSSAIAPTLLSDVQRYLLKPQSSVYVAYQESRKNGPVDLNKAEKVTWDQLQTLAKNANWNVYQNGVTDLVVVYLTGGTSDDEIEAVTRDDAFIGALNALLDKAKVSYVSVLASEESFSSPSVKAMFPTSNHRALERFEQQFQQDSQDDLLPGDLVEALLVMAPFLVILFIGLCCICQVQSELQFGGEKQKKSQ